jgi:predicted nuclease of predicted toxin-antitoxin system
MWLLDVNLPNGLRSVLLEFGIESQSTVYRGWRDLGNGALAKAAIDNGFQAILTRDKLFGESAAKALNTYPQLSVVILRIPQSKADAYLTSFRQNWQKNPIFLVPGQVVEWPKF